MDQSSLIEIDRQIVEALRSRLGDRASRLTWLLDYAKKQEDAGKKCSFFIDKDVTQIVVRLTKSG